jgi:hypothetical protein
VSPPGGIAATLLPADLSSLIGEANTAIAAFGRVARDEPADVLALMMVKVGD